MEAEFLLQPALQLGNHQAVQTEVGTKSVGLLQYLLAGHFMQTLIDLAADFVRHRPGVNRNVDRIRLGHHPRTTTLPPDVRNVGVRRRILIVKFLQVAVHLVFVGLPGKVVRQLDKLDADVPPRAEKDTIEQNMLDVAD